MKKKLFDIKAIIIIVMIFVLGGVSFYFGISKVNSSYQKFYNDGYIIAETNESGSSNKYYFSGNSKYKTNYDETVTITDTSDNKVNIQSNSFVHYNDKSIGATKKSVLLDLDSMEGNVLKYYNFYDDTLLNYKGDSYKLKLFEEELSLENFVLKISDNKFMIVSDALKLTIGEDIHNLNDFIELNFLDGNIVRIENKDYVFQNISSDMKLELNNNIVIDLSNRNVVDGENTVVNLNQISIDSDDNIDIPNNANTTLPRTTKGVYVTTTTPKDNGFQNEEEIDEFIRVVEPTFTVYDLTVTTYSVNCKIKVDDPNGLITGGIDIKVVDANTGVTVSTITETSWFYDIDYSNKELVNNTDYNLIITATINKDGMDYTKTYVQKTFRTESIGINVVKDYFSDSEMNFTITRDIYSDVKTANAYFYDMDGNQKGIEPLNFENGEIKLSFDDLDSNTNYILKIADFDYKGLTVKSEDTIISTFKTLKTKPISTSKENSFGDPLFTANKRDGIFALSYTNIQDPDGGIVEYKYVIYDSNNTTTPIKTITSKNRDEVKVYLEEVGLSRNHDYVFNVVVVFNDNEKIVEYSSGFSKLMNMDGTKVPILSYVETLTTYNKIEGNIIINDVDSVIDVDKNISVVLRDSYGNTKNITYGDISNYKGLGQTTYSLPVSLTDLKSNVVYTFDVYATVDFSNSEDKGEDATIDDTRFQYGVYLLGSINVRTSETIEFRAEWKDYISASEVTYCSKIFNIGLTLKASENSKDYTEEQFVQQLASVDSIKLSIRDAKGEHQAKSTILSKANIIELTKGNEIKITPEMFSLNPSVDFSEEEYELTLVAVYDEQGNEFELMARQTKQVFPCISKIPYYRDLIGKAVKVNELAGYEEVSDDSEDTKYVPYVLGYNVQPLFKNTFQLVNSIKYYIRDLSDPNNTYCHYKKVERKEVSDDETGVDGQLPVIEFNFGEIGREISADDKPCTPLTGEENFDWYKRGGQYDFSYELDIELKDDNKTYNCLYPAYQMESGYEDGKEIDFSKLQNCTLVEEKKQLSSNYKKTDVYNLSLLNYDTYPLVVEMNKDITGAATSSSVLKSAPVYPKSITPYIYIYPVGLYYDESDATEEDKKCNSSSGCYHLSYQAIDLDGVLDDKYFHFNEYDENRVKDFAAIKACNHPNTAQTPCIFKDLYLPLNMINGNLNLSIDYSLTKETENTDSFVHATLFNNVETKIVNPNELNYNFNYTVVGEQYIRIDFKIPTGSSELSFNKLVKIDARFHDTANYDTETDVVIKNISTNAINYKLNYDETSQSYYFIIPLAMLESLKGADVSLGVDMYYDSGEYSYNFVYNKYKSSYEEKEDEPEDITQEGEETFIDSTQLYALRDKTANKYYHCQKDRLNDIFCILNDDLKLHANGSLYTLKGDSNINNVKSIKLNLLDQILMSESKYSLSLTAYGYFNSKEGINLLPMKVKSKAINNIPSKADPNVKTFKFNNVQPVFVLDNIVTSPITAEINYTVAGLPNDSTIYFESLVEIDGVKQTNITEQKIMSSSLNKTVVSFTELLEPGVITNRNVTFKVFYCVDGVECKNENLDKRQYFVDSSSFPVDGSMLDYQGEFTLKDYYHITQREVEIVSSLEGNKVVRKLNFEFTIDVATGFDSIRCVLKDSNGIDIDLKNLSNNHTLKYSGSFEIKNNSVFASASGNKYYISIEPFINSNQDISLSDNDSVLQYTFFNYPKPFSNLSVKRDNATSSIILRSNLNDPNLIIDNLEYKMLFKNPSGEDKEFKNIPVNSPYSNGVILSTNALLNEYSVEISYSADLNANGIFETNEIFVDYYQVKKGNTYGINFGEIGVSVSKASYPILYFYDSDKIEDISRIDYTLTYYNDSGDLVNITTQRGKKYEAEFDASTKLYSIVLNDVNVSSYNNFYITATFFAGGTNGDEYEAIYDFSQLYTK